MWKLSVENADCPGRAAREGPIRAAHPPWKYIAADHGISSTNPMTAAHNAAPAIHSAARTGAPEMRVASPTRHPTMTSISRYDGSNDPAMAATTPAPAMICTRWRVVVATTRSPSSSLTVAAKPDTRRMASSDQGRAADTASTLHRPTEIAWLANGIAAYTSRVASRARRDEKPRVTRQMPIGPTTSAPMMPKVCSAPMWKRVTTLAMPTSARPVGLADETLSSRAFHPLAKVRSRWSGLES
ncbi:MAG: hypothetical protein WCO88_13660 [Actinomycetota bacterium]